MISERIFCRLELGEKIVREMETDLLTMLHRKSPDSFNYRIMIE
jgi:hypothetical protein